VAARAVGEPVPVRVVPPRPVRPTQRPRGGF